MCGSQSLIDILAPVEDLIEHITAPPFPITAPIPAFGILTLEQIMSSLSCNANSGFGVTVTGECAGERAGEGFSGAGVDKYKFSRLVFFGFEDKLRVSIRGSIGANENL